MNHVSYSSSKLALILGTSPIRISQMGKIKSFPSDLEEKVINSLGVIFRQGSKCNTSAFEKPHCFHHLEKVPIVETGWAPALGNPSMCSEPLEQHNQWNEAGEGKERSQCLSVLAYVTRNDEIKKLRDRGECWNCRISFKSVVRKWCEEFDQWLCGDCDECRKKDQCMRMTDIHLSGIDIRCELCRTLYCVRWAILHKNKADPNERVFITCANCNNHWKRRKSLESLHESSQIFPTRVTTPNSVPLD